MAFCTECGTKLPENAQFCTNCGTRQAKLSKDMPQQSAETPDSAAGEELDTAQASDTEAASSKTESGASELHYYTPPQSGGFVPPYKPGAYSFAPPPCEAPVPAPKNRNTALIVTLSVLGAAVLLLVLLAIFLPGRGSNSYIPVQSPVGYWEAEEIDFGNGVFVDEYLGREIEGTMGLQINEDGTIYLGSAYYRDISSGTWSESSEGIVATLNGATVNIAISDDNLVMKDGRLTIIFERYNGSIDNPSIPFGRFSNKDGTPAVSGGNPGASIAGSGNVADGSFHIAIVGAEKITDLNDKPGIRIYYEFTNNSEFSLCAGDVLDFELRQDGSSLSPTYTWDESVSEYYNEALNIRPGISILCIREYNVDKPGNVDFTVFGWSSGKAGGSVTASYSLDALPGRPAPYVIEPISDPKWTLGVPTSGTLDGEFDVSVGGADLIRDSAGDPAIRIYYSFTNNSDSAASLAGTLFCNTYQDGVELAESFLIDELDSDTKSYQSINPGKSINCSLVFKLRNESSPVEAEVEAYETYDAVGQTYYIKK